MNKSSNPRQPPRYLDRWFTDRRIFVWTHLLLAVIAGTIFVISAIASHRLLANRGLAGWVGRGPGPFLAMAFFIAALPYIISYNCNVKQVDERVGRTVIFAAILALTSLLVDIYTALFIRDDLFFAGLVSIYVFQAVGYVWLGDRLLLRDDDLTKY
jgi:hypothetical protein